MDTGHLYQRRFKSFPIEEDGHFLQVCRYVERNASRAGLVKLAEAWRWSSLWQRQLKEQSPKWILSEWPVAEPENWLREVNRVQSEAELEALRRSVQRGRPYAEDGWSTVARRMGLESTLRPRTATATEKGA